MSYDQVLIERGECPELVWIYTEDGLVDGRCRAPIVPGGFACEGHTAEMEQWRAMSEPERAAWEKRRDEDGF